MTTLSNQEQLWSHTHRPSSKPKSFSTPQSTGLQPRMAILHIDRDNMSDGIDAIRRRLDTIEILLITAKTGADYES